MGVLTPQDVAVVIPTRGDHDLSVILERYAGYGDVIVYDNSIQPNLLVYARYVAAAGAARDVILTQDDDCLISAVQLLDLYEPGRIVTVMPRSRWSGYPDSALLGWGSIWDRHLPREAFGKIPDLFASPAEREWFHLTCDVAFSALTPRTIIDLPFEHLPWAEGPDRMFTSRPTHSEERQRMLELCRSIRGEDDDRRDW